MDNTNELKEILTDNITKQIEESVTGGINSRVLAAEIMVVEDLMIVITGMDPEHNKKYDQFHDTICGFVEEMNRRFSV